MMPTVIGGAVVIGSLIGKAPRLANVLLLIVLLMNYGLSSAKIVQYALNGALLVQRAAATHEVQQIIAEQNGIDLPIVVANGSRYTAMAYYAPAGLNRKLYAIVDPRAAVEFSNNKSNTVDLNLLALLPYFPFQGENYDNFLSNHREFLLVTGTGAGDTGGGTEWLAARLVHDGNIVRLLSAKEESTVYRVTVCFPPAGNTANPPLIQAAPAH
jgi:hypothetical protein